MDFDLAVSKLSRDHSQLHKRNLSQKRDRERLRNTARRRRDLDNKRKLEKEKQELKYRAGKAYVTRCEATLRTKESWTFTATSIHGDGDKIALPPSVLASLNETGMLEDARGPLTFRIGVVDPEYKFPASDS